MATITTKQFVHKQAAKITSLVKVAFPALAMALDYFIKAWKGKCIQRHLLAVAPAKEVAQVVKISSPPTQAVTYIGSLFIPERVESLNFLIDIRCMRNLLSQTAYDSLPT